MKRILPLVFVGVLLAMGAAPQRSGWIETFDRFGGGYAYDSDLLPAPWEGAVSTVARAELGYRNSAGAQGPGGGWSWGHAFRPTVETPRVADAMVAKVFLPAGMNYQSVMLALTTDKTPGPSGQFAGGAKAVLHIAGSADERFANVSFRMTDPSDKTLGSVSAAPHPFLPTDAWYDLRLTLGENRTVTAEYKHVDMSYWVPIGTLTAHDDFQPNYVAISAMRQGTLDDVGYRASPRPGPPFSP